MKGGFWTAAIRDFQPKAQFRFRIEIEGLRYEDAPGTVGDSNEGDYANDQEDVEEGHVAWYAKTVDKPGFELVSNVSEGDYFNLGDKNTMVDFNIDQPKLKKVSMTLIDPSYPNVTRKLLRWLRRTGYNDNTIFGSLCSDGKSPEDAFFETIGQVRIYQLDSYKKNQKNPYLEQWTLFNAYPTRIDFGKLDYSSGELVEIQIDWLYSNFVCTMYEFPNSGKYKEQEFPYFGDHLNGGGGLPKGAKSSKNQKFVPPPVQDRVDPLASPWNPTFGTGQDLIIPNVEGDSPLNPGFAPAPLDPNSDFGTGERLFVDPNRGTQSQVDQEEMASELSVDGVSQLGASFSLD